MLGDGEIGGVVGNERVAHRPDNARERLDGVADNAQLGQELKRSFRAVGSQVSPHHHAAKSGEGFDVEVLGDVDLEEGRQRRGDGGGIGRPGEEIDDRARVGDQAS